MQAERRPARIVRPLLAFAAAVLVVRVVLRGGGAVRLSSLAVNRLRYGRPRARQAEDARLYARGPRRYEAHLAHRADGRLAVLALSVDGSARSTAYDVDERSPWHDFERQAGLVGAAWGPCLAADAGL